jgi:hypothetical protein
MVDLAAIRRMARGVMDDKDHLSALDRDVIGPRSVRVDVKLQDSVDLARHLEVLAGAIARAQAHLNSRTLDERTKLVVARQLLREANAKINAYRRIRQE